MRRPACWLAIAAAGILAFTAVAQQPSEASLVTAWEQARRSEASTATFDKIEEGRYRFKTTAFPFEGELQVLSVSIGDPFAEDYTEGMTPGTVDVELVSFPEEAARRHAAAVARWQAGNTLYFEAEGGRWLTAREWQARLAKKVGRWSWVGWLSTSFWIGFLLLLAVFLWFLARKSQRQMKEAMAAQKKALQEQERALELAERGVRLNEEANALLREILEELKKRN
jgi:hypothetical protein